MKKKPLKNILGNSRLISVFLLVVLLTTGCKKFLDEKPNKADVVPKTLGDLMTLLDNTNVMNSNGINCFAEIVSDNYYITSASYQSMINSSNPIVQADVQNHVWSPNAMPGDTYWILGYRPVYHSNLVLDELERMENVDHNDDAYKVLKGSAMFYRAFAFHSLAQLFCKPYSEENANAPGIVLRTTSNAGEVTGRSTVQETYDRITSDLKEASDLLPETTLFLTRPTKAAAYAALARVYLSMRDYVNAQQYANMALSQNSTLMDYNTLTSPIPSFNPEVIFHCISVPTRILPTNVAKIDSTLYKSYNVNDLRKTLFFRPNTGANAGTYAFRGSYNGTFGAAGVFDGLSTNEMYLIRAECAARANDKDAAIADLNTLMSKRWANNGTWTPYTAANAAEALDKILTERRKELIWRGLRWSDIRRLNVEGASLTLKRIIGSNEYTLPPNDLRTVMLIPWIEIKLAGVEQNPR